MHFELHKHILLQIKMIGTLTNEIKILVHGIIFNRCYIKCAQVCLRVLMETEMLIYSCTFMYQMVVYSIIENEV